jgi:hypothetical protein
MRILALMPTLALALCCDGATGVKRDVRELTTRSEAIVHGRIVRQWSAWDASRETIWTHSVLEPVEVLHGREQSSFTISEPGGVVGDVGMDISGAVPFRVGEEVVVFLRRMPNRALRVTGLAAGKYLISTRRASGRARAATAETAELSRLKSQIRAALTAQESTR